MEVYNTIKSYTNKAPCVVTIGTFDGVHIGHRAILSRVVKEAQDMGCASVLFTLFPHPRMVLQPQSNIQLIHTIEERQQALAKTGIEHLIIAPFTIEFSRISALEFVRDILVNTLNAKKVIVGYDHRFGRNRNANVEDLKAFGKTYNFSVQEITAQDVDSITVSSTKIRKALQQGDVTKANRYLTQPFTITGTVVHGAGRGRKLGFPTANLEVTASYKLIPENGVYLVKTVIDNTLVYGITNIGNNPTFGKNQRSIETFFLNFTADLYNKVLALEFISRIRDEQEFKSKAALVEAIAKDRDYAQAYVNANK